MADTTSTSKIVTDPHTLLSATHAVYERIAPRAGALGPYTNMLIQQLRLLFIDPGQALFVFGVPDPATLAGINTYARTALERALEEVFEEEVRVELVVFDENGSSLTALIEDFTRKPAGSDQTEAGQPLEGPAILAVDAEETIDDVEEEAPPLNKIQLGLIQSSLRGVFTSPKRVVVVPGYLLRWLPYIGPLRTSIVVACFQAFYLSRRTTARANLPFEAPGPLLAAVAGIAESSVWRHLNDPELSWFLKKAPYKAGEKRWVRDKGAGLTKRRPTRFLFRSTSPLTPGDAAALCAYLKDLDIQENPLEALTSLVRGEYRVEPRDVFPFPAPPPPKDWQAGDPEACLIHNIIYAAIGIEAKSASKPLADLVDELVERLLPTNDQLHLSWYYLLHWQPLLGHGPGWAVTLLRDRCFYNRQTGELRDTVNVKGGYQELADALGLQRVKTVREWFPAPRARKETVKNADLSSEELLEAIAQAKRGFVKEYAAKFVEIATAEADGRGQVSAFKARVKVFDPLAPVHEALYNALFPFAQRCFTLPQEQRAAFLDAFDETCALDASAIEKIIRETRSAADQLIQKHRISFRPEFPCALDNAIAGELLGAIERITNSDLGANRRFISDDLGAIDEIPQGNSGADESITNPNLGGFGRILALFAGAIEKITTADSGAFRGLGLVFWAHVRGLKHLVLNNPLDITLKEYFQNTEVNTTKKITSTTTTEEQDANLDRDNGGVDVETDSKIKKWDLDSLLNNFSPHVKRDLLEKDVTAEAVLSCLFYIASSKGDNLGLGYIVEKLKVHPQDGQGGIYLRLAGDKPEEIIARLRAYVEYRSFQNRDWRVAMGTPSTEKILELLEHLGIDSSKIRSQWD